MLDTRKFPVLDYSDLIQQFLAVIRSDIKERGFNEVYRNPRPPSFLSVMSEHTWYFNVPDTLVTWD